MATPLRIGPDPADNEAHSAFHQGGALLEHSRELLERMLDPLALVSRTGETLEANRAFHRLAARRGVPPVLSALFGAELQPLLEQALREANARATLQAAAGPEPRPWFRV